MEQNYTKVVWVSDQYEKALKDELKTIKKEKRTKKIQKQIKKGKRIGMVFVKGVKANAFNPTTLGVCTVVGLAQGLKYSGNIKRGVLTGLVTLAAISVVGGIATVGRNMSTINMLSREDE